MLHSLALASSRLTHETGNAIEDGAFAKNAYVTASGFLVWWLQRVERSRCKSSSIPAQIIAQTLGLNIQQLWLSLFSFPARNKYRFRVVYNTSPSAEGCRLHDAEVIITDAEERALTNEAEERSRSGGPRDYHLPAGHQACFSLLLVP